MSVAHKYPEFSWSLSRHKMLSGCPRKYFFLIMERMGVGKRTHLISQNIVIA